ncbi:MAG: hypothetical protein H6Q15_2165 [Bacteroidetes bacterium]|nr:hypothetical protein [Bacteroidota bacterium]
MERTDFQGWILGLIKKTLSENRQYFYKITDQADKIIVWLVGFSVTSIALTISHSEELNLFLKNLSNYVLIFGSLTVILGVLYRIFVFIAQSLELRILLEFETYVEGYNSPPIIHVGRDINDSNTYDEIVDFIKTDFEIEIERIDITVLNTAEITKIRQAALNYYNSLNYWNNKQFEKEKEGVKSVLMSQLGNSKRKVEKVFNDTTPNKYVRKVCWISLFTSQTLFVLSCLSFTTGMIIILAQYIIKISG